MIRIALLLLLISCPVSAAEPPAGSCWYTYGGLSAREFKKQADSLSNEVQRHLNKYKNPNDPFWPKKASATVDVSGYNVAVVNYVCCLYEKSSWYTASVITTNGKTYLIVKGISL